ncbi:MAG: PAS domain S-box protein, partial [Microcystaceae cyanobacterium]
MSKLFTKPWPFSIPLRWVLIAPFVVQIVGAVSLVGYFSYQSGQKAVNHLADHLMTEVGDRVDQHLDSYLGNAQTVNQMNLDAVKSGVLDLNNFQGLGKYFYRQARSFNFSYVNFGGVDGSFIGAGNAVNNQFGIAEISPSNPNLLRFYAVNQAGDRGALRGTAKNPQTNNRAWYVDAVKAGKPIWSKLYSWAELPDHVSLSASAPVFDQRQQLQGVLGIDLELSQISHFLRTLTPRLSGNIFIIERSGLLIASSDREQITSVLEGKVQRKAAIAAQNPQTRAVAKSLIQKFGTFTAISEQNSSTIQKIELSQQPPLFVKVRPYQDKYGLDWLVVTVVPERHFLSIIQENVEKTIFLCTLILLVAIALGILTARWITRPIKQLGRASEALAKGKWQETLSENSPIFELQQLALSFNQMSVQLQQSFTEVAEELQDSRTLYQRVVQTQTDFILRSLPDTTITFANEALCKTLGQNLEQVVGQKWISFANSDDIVSTIEQLSRLTPENFSFVAENRDQRAGGQIGWTQWINQGIFNEEGELIEIQSVGRDITALKEADTKLRESQRFIERITEVSPSLLYIYDHIEERNIYANRSVVEILGYSVEEIQAIGSDLFNTICHPDDLSKLYECFQQIRALETDDQVVEIEYRVIDAQGNWHWLLSRDLVFARTEDGAVWQTLGNAQDISDRKRAELEIWKAQNFLNSIIENIPDMVFVKDATDLKFISFNKAGEDLLGYSREELLGKGDLDLFPKEQAEFFVDKDRKVLAEGNVLDIFQETIQTKALETRILHTKKIPIFDELGQAQYLLGISEDITELLESENRLTQIARHIPGMIYQFRMRSDGSFHFPYASEGIQEIYGVTPQQVRESADLVLAVLHPDDLNRVYQSILDSATSLTPWHSEYRVCFPDGRIIWLVGDATPKKQADGSIIWHGYIADVSDRQRVEMALRESETKFSTIFHNSPDPVWIALFESGYFI